MPHLPPLFSDLALILITAGITTIIFKWLKQPLVLGYIVAGFIISPFFDYYPSINDTKNISVWSDIGVVFLLFALGLEFSFKKLKKVGGTGAITALTELIIMFLIGSGVGKILGWSSMNCIFLGCMLSISSTTIIIKAFDDLKMKRQKFSNLVFGVLVVEDLIAVLLLVLLSTISVSNQFNGEELVFSLLKLVFFLIIWFTFGIYMIPSFLKLMRKFMTEETLSIVSVGLCFGMVVLATYAGFSSALGAFIMGSILAETIEADAIHRLINPIKNLFGAIFFVSVGTLVDPKILVEYATPIIVIALVVMVVKTLSATIGILLSGQDLKTSMQSGFCFCQIGEFSFIIASLGVGFKVIDPYLYPIIVSVSILTTFFTPYIIRAAIPCYNKIYPKLPEQWKVTLNRYSMSGKTLEGQNYNVKEFVTSQLSHIAIYGSILIALSFISFTLFKPFITTKITGFWGELLGLLITLLVLAPFLRALMVKRYKANAFRKFLFGNKLNHGLVISILILRYVIALFFVGMVISKYINLAAGLLLVIAMFVLFLTLMSRRVMNLYQHIEKRFIDNLNQRQSQTTLKIPEILNQNFHLETLTVNSESKYVGKKLSDSTFREEYGINVVSIQRGHHVMDLPDKDTFIYPGDKLTIIGSDKQISHFKPTIEIEDDLLIKEQMKNEMNLHQMHVSRNSQFLNKAIKFSGFREKYRGMIIAIEHESEFILNPASSTVFHEGDRIWFVSSNKEAQLIFSMEKHSSNMKKENKHEHV